ncbi:expressed protein [Phakopsora pachyrhizi]|uniref:Expressed protein n=1 Tax=Phakopsora pachyrhizi TaxID=170000 RepID=A0AAV0BAM9_PHAPC|nr:expressed protein [Phakopsora pachyrhizi]
MIDGLNYLTIIERFKCKEFPRLRTADEDWIRSVDYFGLFGFDSKDFEIDLKVLRQRFHEWQQIVHPDLLNSRKNQTVVEKRDLHNVYEKVEKIRPGEGLSSIINKGYQTLKDDLKRAEYMVELSGIVRLSEENDSFDDKEFLMEVIESREMIEGAESFDEVNNFKNSNKESIDRINEELSKKFKEIKSIEITKDRDHSSPTDEIRIKGLFQDVKTLIIKLRYFKNFDQICKDKLF